MPQANLLPDPQAAYDHLFQNVHQRVFFQKLAASGYHYENAEQAGYLLQLAGKLRLANQEQQVKAASSGSDPYAAALSHLDGVLGDAGFNSVKVAAAQDQDWAIKQAAAELMEDHSMYNSVLSLKQAQADQYAREQAANAGR